MKKTEEEIMSTWKSEYDSVLVSIRCLTYNHAPYIKETIDSFLVQETNFPFEIVIHDDASTDGTEEIIREYEKQYPHIIVARYEEENQFSKGNTIKIRYEIDEKLRGKYVAWCEGDDCWNDENKLQRQFDFMESHPEYSLCYHPVLYVSEDGKIIGNDSRFREECDVTTNQVIAKGGLFCASCSLFMKKDDFIDWPKFRELSDIGDYPLQIHLALKGKVRYLNTIMGKYRIAIAGSWTATTNGSKEKLLIHFNCEKKWLSELNKYTDGKYIEEIKWHIVDYIFDTLIPAGVYSKRKAWSLWRKLTNNKEKFILAIRILSSNVRKFIKLHFPSLLDKYKKIRFGV